MTQKPLTGSYINQFKILLKGEPWYGDAFEEKLKDVSAQKAYLKPYQMHSIVELMWHMSYWHKVLLEVLQGGTYPEDKSRQWLAVEELDFDDLKLQLFHFPYQIITELEKKDDDSYLQQSVKPGLTLQELIEGVIHHDIYHLGQVGIIRRLIESQSS